MKLGSLADKVKVRIKVEQESRIIEKQSQVQMRFGDDCTECSSKRALTDLMAMAAETGVAAHIWLAFLQAEALYKILVGTDDGTEKDKA